MSKRRRPQRSKSAVLCRLCGKELERHEQPEKICDGCLRENAVKVRAERKEAM